MKSMKKINTAPISGMQELLPGLQAEFNRFKSEIAEVFARHGFQNIETPMIERSEILLAKAGGDTEKQIYKVVKTAEAAEGADQALRFDHTVPLARYTVEHMNDLAFPFKVSQIGRNFRGERAQRGRFREFYQCDVDVIGWNTLPVAYDAEVILTLIDALKTLPIPSFRVRVSNRKILSGMLEELNLQHRAAEVFNIVDHAEKVPAEATERALAELGIGSENVVRITTFSRIRGRRDEVMPRLEALGFTGETFRAGLGELSEVMQLLEAQVGEATTDAQLDGSIRSEAEKSGAGEAASRQAAQDVSVEADMLIVRGLDYYTGTVFETMTEHRELGSICSGGHYEDLAGYYTDQKLPGVGGSIGLTRLFFLMRELGLVTESKAKPVDVCVVPISRNEYAAAEELARRLRAEDERVDVVLSDKKLGDKMKYAAKVARAAVVVGEDEARTGEYRIKDLETGETRAL